MIHLPKAWPKRLEPKRLEPKRLEPKKAWSEKVLIAVKV